MAQTIPDLDPAILADMLRATVAALPVDPDASADDLDAQRQAALLAVMALCPRDSMEAMLAARIVSAHHAAMECFRRAARHDIDDNAALRLQGKAISLANLAQRTLRELRKCQAEPPAYPVVDLPQAASEPPAAIEPAVSRPPAHPAIAVPATQPDAPCAPVTDHALARNGPPPPAVLAA
jgi:hypothetical protein